MDTIDRKIIALLTEDSRRSLADIGGSVGMSVSAVNERIRRMTASGAIRRFTVDIDPLALGLGVLAFVWVELAGDADEQAFRDWVATVPAITECHHVTGGWSYLTKVRVGTLADLEAFLGSIKARGYLARSETVIVLSTVSETAVAATLDHA
ncbi:AsnC family transcriptional regulator [Devosia limi DSM 17137]|uniref:AsnC family transcriptional regulator n=1 Tax=Devosia limi DSM 17137 TaxID=1121477 RepID=A0A0F5LR51_9HYPH|nr:Lrp/AsnC family transcriptional regulator [Devosia limi]KKB84137.1 AsnC family transcriptional regulator [Devosia limi DSM 17137]SHF91130.1 Lrp/AsnC family transcriptional regulator, leucine-responsive regulatory protein [Devosia limi DSM 17137]